MARQIILILSILFLLLPHSSNSQYYQYDDPISSASVFTDPIRRALGLWGRLLNRMAQTSPPTDDQLHLTKITEERVEEVPINSAKSQQQSTFSNILVRSSGEKGSANSIINEKKLLELLPRLRSPSRTTVAVETSATNTSLLTTTISSTASTNFVRKASRPSKKNKKKGKKKASSFKTSTLPTTTITTSAATTRNNLTPKDNNSTKGIAKKTVNVYMRTLDTLFAENSSFEDVLLKNNNTSFDKAVEKETEKLISDIENVLNEEQWIIPPNNKKNKTLLPSVIARSNIPSQNESLANELDEEGSGESNEKEELSEESEEMSEEDESAVVESSASNDFKEALKARTITTHKPSTTTTSTNSVTASTPKTISTTDKPKKLSSPNKKKAAVNGSLNANIPEAEEEEVAIDISQLQLDTSTASITGQNVFNVNSNANSDSNPQLASVITPVNSIIDGIGPLILPLIGYSRQAISQYYPRRVEGASLYQPETQETLQSTSLHSLPAKQTVEQPSYSFSNTVPVSHRRQYAQPTSPQLPQYPPIVSRTAMPTTEAQHISKHVRKQSQQNHNFTHFSEMNTMLAAVPTPNLSNRIVNAETVVSGAGNVISAAGPPPRFMPSPSIVDNQPAFFTHKMQQQTPMPTIFASDAIRRALANILNRAGESPKIRQISGSNVADIPYFPPDIPQHKSQRYGGNVIRESFNGFQSTATAVSPDILAKPSHKSPSSSTKTPKLKTKEDEEDPGYDKGRSNVESTFYSDSGIMVQESPSKDKTALREEMTSFGDKVQSESIVQSGFGGGRRPSPDSPF